MIARRRRRLAGVAVVPRLGASLRIVAGLRIGASWVRSRWRDGRDGGARLVVRNQVGAGLRRDGGRGAGVQQALDVVVDHAEEEGQARAVGLAVAQACGCVLRARGLGENCLLRAAAGGLAADLVAGGEELIHWEAGGEGDERGGGEEDGGGMHFDVWVGWTGVFKWIEKLERLLG